ncbi:penicillin-binding protein activator LpoB [Helicobacter sp. faydin-H20]|uniref:penicillin-binding protein activator LpoB n=1 Tax=Helicobacter anatolicus TaxID=2905874 RepID=UPI001E49C81E|nr:penicillin-binding protein activator LpoB [Helicobacter anatolicus]MCE3037347.1 penicillin-binding protein activator LpoB [Helicobacter anatolicus]
MKIILQLVLLLMVAMTGCAKKHLYGDAISKIEEELTNAQLKEISKQLARDFVQTSQLDGKKYVINLSDITSISDQDIDIEFFGRSLVREIRKNSDVIFINSIARSGGKRDDMLYQVRDLRKEKEYNQEQVVKEGKLIAPNLSLSGKITQKNTKISNGKIKKEYVFLISVTSIETGEVVWDKDMIITQIKDVKEEKQSYNLGKNTRQYIKSGELQPEKPYPSLVSQEDLDKANYSTGETGFPTDFRRWEGVSLERKIPKQQPQQQTITPIPEPQEPVKQKTKYEEFVDAGKDVSPEKISKVFADADATDELHIAVKQFQDAGFPKADIDKALELLKSQKQKEEPVTYENVKKTHGRDKEMKLLE